MTDNGRRLRFFLIGAFLHTSVALSQHAGVLNYKPSVLIDTVRMDEESRASVITALGTAAFRPENLTSWKTVVVQKSEGLFNVIAREFRYSDKLYPLTADAIADLIAENNGILNRDVLKEGQTLRIPPLPVRPHDKGASWKLAQIVPLNKPTVTTNWKDFIQSGIAETSAEKPKGTTFVLPNLSQLQLARFLAQIPEPIKKRVLGRTIYVGPLTETVPITPLAQAACPLPPPSPIGGHPGSIQQSVSALKSEHAGKYYILDLFERKDKDGCSHGDNVYEVAKRTLQWFGASHLVNNLVKIELDPTQDGQKEVARKFIYRYAEAFTQDIELKLRSVADELLATQQPNPEAPPHVPLLLISAINYDLIRQPNTSIVSSSYYALADGFKWLPDDYKPQSTTVLINAVLNEDTIIEDPTNSKAEPIQTFWKMRRDFGLILVGAEHCPGTPAGMYSREGDGVTLIAPGYGWGSQCLSRGGTSLATPYAGAQLLIAQAYWHSFNLTVDAREARTRILLASEISPSYIGRYASGGIPKLERLLRVSGTFATRSDNSVVSVKITQPSSLTYSGSDGLLHTKYFRRSSGHGDDFRALQFSSGTLYIFNEQRLRWEIAHNPSLIFYLEENGIEVMHTLQSLTQRYKEVTIL